MNLKAASRMFSIDPHTVTDAEVRAKFGELLREVHPDSAVGKSEMAGALIWKYKNARRILLAHVEKRAEMVDCTKCNGTGKMATRSGGLIKCSTCNGEGEYTPRHIRRS